MASTLAQYRASPMPVEHHLQASREQTRDLPPFRTTPAHAMEDGRHLPSIDPISRPSSTSTTHSTLHHSASLPQLPGLSALASLASSNSPQLRAYNVPSALSFSASSPSATSGGGPSNSPVRIPLRSFAFVESLFPTLLCLVLPFLYGGGSPHDGWSSRLLGRLVLFVYLPSWLSLYRATLHSWSLSLAVLAPSEIFVHVLSYRIAQSDSSEGQNDMNINININMATMANTTESSQPTCQNCTTSTTPLWRRDEIGSVLCNACGLFLKLHGRPRPISLKTDVIKSRNRVKSTGTGPGPKKKVFDANGMEMARSQAGTPPPGSLSQRRTSQKSANGHSDGSNSPISRTATPSMYAHAHGLPPYNGTPLEDHYNGHSPSLPPLHLRAPSPGRSASPMNGAHSLEVPQTYEQLIAQNTSLKTRVSELEVINDLFRGRVSQLEQDENNARRGEEMRRDSEHDLIKRLEESQRRENQLKHRLDDVERELSDMRDGAPRAKKMRVADMVGDAASDSSTPSVTG